MFPYLQLSKLIFIQKLRRDVCIIESIDQHVARIVLSAPDTAMMCAITSSHAYCMYPRLHDAMENVNHLLSSGGWWHPIFLSFTFGLRTYASTEYWDRPCASACPVIWRRLNGSVLTFHCNDDSDVCHDPLEHNVGTFLWRLPSYSHNIPWCPNSLCPNFGRVVRLIRN